MAAVQSMTGFANLDLQIDGLDISMDVRSVNNRAMDVRVRLPSGFERQEQAVRKAIAARFRRGSINVSVAVRRAETEARYAVNHEQLAAYVDEIQALASSGSVAAPRADGLHALRGVIEAAQDETGKDDGGDGPDLSAALETLLGALEEDRLAEGARIAPVVSAQLTEMARIHEAIDRHPDRALPAVKARLDAQLGEMLSATNALSEDRLHQEAALLATRSDVREELDRLAAHIAAARALLEEGGAIGRKLDFLAQEFNRETNTICAKAPHHTITALGLELKAVLEQMREQVQNLE